MEAFGFVNVAAITVLCYLVGNFIKVTGLDNKWIPSIVGFAGLLLGIAAFMTGMPDFPASDVLTAAAVGVASGLAATGVNQVTKQLSKGDE